MLPPVINLLTQLVVRKVCKVNNDLQTFGKTTNSKKNDAWFT